MSTIGTNYGLQFFVLPSSDRSHNQGPSQEIHDVNQIKTKDKSLPFDVDDSPSLASKFGYLNLDLIASMPGLSAEAVRKIYMDDGVNYADSAKDYIANLGNNNVDNMSNVVTSSAPTIGDARNHLVQMAYNLSEYIGEKIQTYNSMSTEYTKEYIEFMKKNIGEDATEKCIAKRQVDLNRIGEEIGGLVDEFSQSFQPDRPIAEYENQLWKRNAINFSKDFGGGSELFSIDVEGQICRVEDVLLSLLLSNVPSGNAAEAAPQT